MNIEQMGISQPEANLQKNITQEVLDFYEEKKGERIEAEEIVEIIFKKDKIEEIGQIFKGPYMEAFTKAVSEGAIFEDADKIAQDFCLEYDKNDQHYNPASNKNGAVYGNVMAYTSRSGAVYELFDDGNGDYRFVYPDTSHIALDIERMKIPADSSVDTYSPEWKEKQLGYLTRRIKEITEVLSGENSHGFYEKNNREELDRLRDVLEKNYLNQEK